jgi:hypothetical protein
MLMRLPFDDDLHDQRRLTPRSDRGGTGDALGNSLRNRPTDPLAEAIDEAARTGEWRTEPLRAAVVGFARRSRDEALQLEETLGALRFRLRTLLDRLAAGARDELMTSVQWWAVHGYHRAD